MQTCRVFAQTVTFIMRLIFKCGRPVNSNGLTMAWSICYSAAAEIKLNKPKKRVQASKRVSILLIVIK